MLISLDGLQFELGLSIWNLGAWSVRSRDQTAWCLSGFIVQTASEEPKFFLFCSAGFDADWHVLVGIGFHFVSESVWNRL